MWKKTKEWFVSEEKRNILFAIISAVTLILSLTGALKSVFPFDIAWVAILLCGIPIVVGSVTALITEHDIKADVLVSIALLASIGIGEYFAAGEVAIIMAVGTLLEDVTARKARKGIEKLIDLTPKTARVKRSGKEEIIPADDVEVDDVLVVFAGEAFTQTPLTTDQSSLQTLLGRLHSGVVEDGTAIGNGLATAVNRLRESDSKSKVIILLTDGVNNRGQIAPLTVADIAKEQNIKVYTIGVGRNGTAPYPVFDERGREVYTVDMKVEIDEKMLSEIAEKTGGEYFRATDKLSLERIYEQIDKMEKSKVEKFDITHVHEEYLLYVLAAIALLVLEFLVKYIVLKRIP
ncbi:MAG: VWA domain-containing protein [Ruminococcaceae bacterium]|nr:VWA domain-containing protein [Oscillospiraceae bacterium]